MEQEQTPNLVRMSFPFVDGARPSSQVRQGIYADPEFDLWYVEYRMKKIVILARELGRPFSMEMGFGTVDEGDCFEVEFVQDSILITYRNMFKG